MNKRNENNFKQTIIAGILACVLIISGKQIYSHYFPTKEEQAQQAALKLQEAFKEKMQDELIKAAERLEKEKQPKETEPEVKQQEEIEPQIINQEAEIKSEQKFDSNSVAQKDISNNNEKDNSENSEKVTAFGITIGKTTEKEIRRKFSVIDEGQSKVNSVLHKELSLNTKDFSTASLHVESFDVVVNPQGIVEALRIEFSGQYFQKLHETLNQKYKLQYKEDPFVGNHTARYTKGDVIIVLEQPHMGGFRTILRYVAQHFARSCDLDMQKRKEQEKQRLSNQF